MPPPPDLPQTKVWGLFGTSPPPPLYKLRPCPSYSGCRDCINLVPNLIRYQM